MKNWSEIEGWSDDEVTRLYDLAVERAMDGDVFVEVGRYKGRSTQYLIEAIKRTGKKIHLDVVDTWQWEANPEGEEAKDGKSVYEQFLSNVDTSYIRNFHKLSSIEASNKYEDGEIQFLFLDTEHYYAHVKNEIASWFPKLKRGGILSGHDYGDGCKKAVDEFAGEGNVISYTSKTQVVFYEGVEYHWNYVSWMVEDLLKIQKLKEDEEISLFFKDVNETSDEITKFKSFINEVKIEKIDLPKTSGDKRICVAYMLWSHRSYLKMMYHSILSIRTYVDDRVDFLVFAYKDIHGTADVVLSPLIGENRVIKLEDKEFYRHSVAKNKALREYETVLFCDTDGMVLSYPGSNLIEKIYEISRQEDVFFCYKTPAPSFSNFLQMFSIVNDRTRKFRHFGELVKIFNESLSIDSIKLLREAGYWIMGGFISFRTDFYENGREYFLELTEILDSKEWSCDETVWLLWAEKHSIKLDSCTENKVIDWKLGTTESEYNEYFLKKNWIEDQRSIFFHPIIGREEYCKKIVDFLSMIREDAKQKFDIHIETLCKK